jgi:hypothetical protein
MGDAAGGEIDHRHAALAQLVAADLVAAPVGHIEAAAIAAGVQPVRTDAGGNEAGLAQAFAIDHMHAIGHHVRNEEGLAIG